MMNNRSASSPPGSSPRRTKRSGHTYRMAVCSVFCALGVVILGVGIILEVMDMTAATLAALLLLPILLGYGSRYALICWAVTSVLALVLMPHNFGVWVYLCLFGYYPVLKRQLDRLPRLVGYLLKLALVLTALTLYLLLFWWLMLNGEGNFVNAFLTGFGEPGGSAVMSWALVGGCVLVFLIFDLLIDKLYILYRHKWKKRVEKWLK